MRTGLLLLLAIATSLTLAPDAEAQAAKVMNDPDVIIEIGGLSCPFCAYGVEKRLRKLDGIEHLSILLEEGIVQVRLEDGATVSESQFKKAVKDAGFEAIRVTFLIEDADAGLSDKADAGPSQ